MEPKRKKKIKPPYGGRPKGEGRKLPQIAVFFIRFYKPLAAVAVVMIFFIVYNLYITDQSLADIKFALEQTANAQSLDDLQGLNMILGNVVLKEAAAKKVDSESLVKLDFVVGVTSKAEVLSQVNDIKFMLSDVLAKKKKARPNVLAALDGINQMVVDVRNNLAGAVLGLQKKGVVAIEPDQARIQAAQEFEQRGEIEQAIKVYEMALKQVPQYQGMDKVRLGFLYQTIENFNKAQIVYEEVNNNAAGTNAANFAARFLANLRKIRELSDKKKSLEDAILHEASTDILQQLYYDLGATKSLMGDSAGAQQAYQRSVDLNPETDLAQKARFNIGFGYKMQGRYEESENVFKQLSEDFPQGSIAVDSSYWVADTLNSQGKYEEALKQFEQVADKFKDNPIAAASLFRAGYSCMYDLKDPVRAKMFFAKLNRQFGQSGIAKYAIEQVDANMANIYRDAGFKLILAGKLDEANSKFSEAIRLNPKDARSYGGSGSAKALLEQWKEAMVQAKKAVELAPNDSYTNATLGFIYILQNDYDSATTTYEKAVTLDPKYGEAQYNLGWLYQENGQYEKAIAAYKDSIKHRPKLAMAHNNLGTCYFNLDRINEASEEFSLAIQLDDKLADAHYNLGLAHIISGRLKQAEAELVKSMELNKDLPEAQKVLDLIRQKLQE